MFSSVPVWHATVDSPPATAAALFVAGGTSLLTGAAALPGFRGRGCQTALVARRFADAATCSDLAVVTAAFASASHDNLARQGFQVTHTRAVWHCSNRYLRAFRQAF